MYSSDLKPFLKITILAQYVAHKHIGDMPVLSQFAPIWGNKEFQPGEKDRGFWVWHTKGVQKIIDHSAIF